MSVPHYRKYNSWGQGFVCSVYCLGQFLAYSRSSLNIFWKKKWIILTIIIPGSLVLFSSPFYRCENWALEKWSKVPQATQQQEEEPSHMLWNKCQSVQFSYSVVSNSFWPHGLQHTRASLSIPNSWSLLKFMSIESVMPSKYLIICCSLLLLPSIVPSIRIFSNESALCIGWPMCWSFSFRIRPSNEYSRLISFRMDWLDLVAV